MKLKILLPTEVLVNLEVNKVIAEAENGHFCLLTHHIDFLTALVPGILSYTTASGNEVFVAVDGGILVKCDREVLVSTHNAVVGNDLETLKKMVVEQFQVLDEREKLTRSALAQFEASTIRYFQELSNV
jgi:F-type H+-transporting ATPase subunit epsilon